MGKSAIDAKRGNVFILYHFCPAHMVSSIKKNGLTLGKIPLIGDKHISLIGGYQWLTSESEPQNQSWATSVTIPYSRTAYRLTIDIPENRHYKITKAIDFMHDFPQEQRELVEQWAGSKNWYLFKGTVFPKWITAFENMEQ